MPFTLFARLQAVIDDYNHVSVQYFNCPEYTGLFVLASKVQVLLPEGDDNEDKCSGAADNGGKAKSHSPLQTTAATTKLDKLRRQASPTTNNNSSGSAETSNRSPCKSTAAPAVSRSTRPKTARACASSTCRSKRRSLVTSCAQKGTDRGLSESKNQATMNGELHSSNPSIPALPTKSSKLFSTLSSRTRFNPSTKANALSKTSKSTKTSVPAAPVKSKSTRNDIAGPPIESKSTRTAAKAATISPNKSKSTKPGAELKKSTANTNNISRTKTSSANATTASSSPTPKRSKSARTITTDNTSPLFGAPMVKSKSTRSSTARDIMTKSKSSTTTNECKNSKTLQSTSRSTATRRTRHRVCRTEDDIDSELSRMQELLEEARRDRERLSKEVNSKDAAWDRIVSTKESYALQVQDKEREIRCLEQALAASQEKLEALTNQAHIQSSQQAILEQQRQRITKLDILLQEAQTREKSVLEDYRDLQQESAARLDQVERLLADRNQAVAMLEQECNDLRRTNKIAAQSYQESTEQAKAEYIQALVAKDREIAQLRQALNDLIVKQRAQEESLGPQFVQDDQKRRLEQQLQSALTELDRERHLVLCKTQQVDTVNARVIQLQDTIEAFDKRCQELARELETEIKDKKRIMEEVNLCRQACSDAKEQQMQAELAKQKAEQDLKLVQRDSMQIKHEYDTLLTSHKALEESYNRLLRQVATTQQGDTDGSSNNNAALCQQVLRLSDELERQKNQITTLKAENQSLKSTLLERQQYTLPMSPVSIQSFKRSSLSSFSSGTSFNDHDGERNLLYCEICEMEGHDVMNCTAYLENVSMVS